MITLLFVIVFGAGLLIGFVSRNDQVRELKKEIEQLKIKYKYGNVARASKN